MEHLEIIKTCGINLTELMNDILDLASIEAGGGEIAVDGFSPEQIINECIEIFCIKAEENNVKIKFQPEKLARELVGARKRFKQIMFNLIGNAIKFTHDGQVEIETDFKEDHLQVKVKDSGIGIPDEMKEKILLPFTQGDQSSTRKYGGTGLGLTIVSKNLNILGGKLHINSELGKGTTVSFTFPAKLKDNNVIQCVDNKKCSELKTNCNILLVEDNEISVLYLKRIFNSLGISYKIAMCFAEMKDVCDQGFMPDVVLMDISLPNESGFECFKWLKDKFHERKIKYIAQTAHVLIEETECYKSEGFDSFIGKPYTKEELISTINSVL
jgi:CheY-like chemotaxis protein